MLQKWSFMTASGEKWQFFLADRNKIVCGKKLFSNLISIFIFIFLFLFDFDTELKIICKCSLASKALRRLVRGNQKTAQLTAGFEPMYSGAAVDCKITNLTRPYRHYPSQKTKKRASNRSGKSHLPSRSFSWKLISIKSVFFSFKD